MPTTADLLDLTLLPATARREVRDFYQFILNRRKAAKKRPAVDNARYHFTDLCGTLTWKEDAVAAQRRLRDEW